MTQRKMSKAMILNLVERCTMYGKLVEAADWACPILLRNALALSEWMNVNVSANAILSLMLCAILE